MVVYGYQPSYNSFLGLTKTFLFEGDGANYTIMNYITAIVVIHVSSHHA